MAADSSQWPDLVQALEEQAERMSTIRIDEPTPKVHRPPQPIFRIWGHADNLARSEYFSDKYDYPWGFNIQLDSHEDLKSLDAGGSVERRLNISQSLASEHTTVRLDRHSHFNSFNPFLNELLVDRVDGEFDIVQVYLFDRGGGQGCESSPQHASARDVISRELLKETVDGYFSRLSNAPGAVISKTDKTPTQEVVEGEIGGKVETKIKRGRHRRRDRRHKPSLSNALASKDDLVRGGNRSIAPAQDTSEDHVSRRGRAKRRYKRDMHYGRRHEGDSKLQRQPLRRPALPEKKRLLPHTDIILRSRLPKELIPIPRILFLGPQPNDFIDSVVIPLPIPNDQQSFLGSFVLSSSFLTATQHGFHIPSQRDVSKPSWMPILLKQLDPINLTKTFYQVGVEFANGPMKYWQKFPLNIVRHLASRDKFSRVHQELQTFDLSRWSSYGHPRLIYPDLNDMSLADDPAYYELFICWRYDFFRRGASDESGFVEWMRKLDGDRNRERNRSTKRDPQDEPFEITTDASPESSFNSVANDLESKGIWPGLFVNVATYPHVMKRFEWQLEREPVYSPMVPSVLSRSESDGIIGTHLEGKLEPQDNMVTGDGKVFGKEGKMSIDTHTDSSSNHDATEESHDTNPRNEALPGDKSKATYNESEAKQPWSVYISEDMERDGIREIWYGAREYSHVSLWQQEQIFDRIASLCNSDDVRLAPRVKAHAAFEYGLCLLSGFGIEQEIEIGLAWIQHGAVTGSRLARAVAHGLHRAYGRESKLDDEGLGWLSAEATCFSEYAQRELELFADETTSTSIRQRQLFYAKYEVERPWLGFIKPTPSEKEFVPTFDYWVLPRLAKNDPDLLGRQLRLEDRSTWDILVPLLSTSAPQDSPLLFYKVSMRWACCFSELAVFRVLFEHAGAWIGAYDLHELTLLALMRGSASLAMFLLEHDSIMANSSNYWDNPSKSSTRNPLFLLNNVADGEVGPLVQKIVDLGFDVNGKSQLDEVERQAIYPYKKENRWDPASPKHKWNLHVKDEILGESITPLRWAIAKNRSGLARALIDSGATFPLVPEKEVYARTMPKEGWPADTCTVAILDQPCYNIEILNMFLDKHGKQKGQPVFSESPLGLIVMEPDSPMRRLRIAQHNAKNPGWLQPVLSILRKHQPDTDAELLWAAVMNGHDDVVRCLIAEGVDIELRWKGMTPLHTSILHGRTSIFLYLLECGADVWATTTDKGISALHLLFWNAKPAGVEEVILEELHNRLGEVTGKHGEFGETVSPLHLAIMNSRVEAVEELLKLGADRTGVLGREIMTTILGEQYTASGIEWQVRKANAHTGFQTYKQVPLEPIEIKGYTPAGIILMREDMFLPEDASLMLEMLLSTPDSKPQMENFYTRPDIKQTVLHLLVWSELNTDNDILDRVLELGSTVGLDMNVKDCDGDTPLHYAYAVRGPKFNTSVDALLARGADLTIRNDLGLTPPEMRAHILRNMYPSETRPLQLKLSLHHPRYSTDEHVQHPPPPPLRPGCQPWWSLEEGLLTKPEFWDVKTRKMVKLPPAQDYLSKREVERRYGFEVTLETPGWKIANRRGADHILNRVVDTEVVFDMPDSL